MDNRVAFLIWTLAGCLEIGDGIRCFFSKEPIGYFANRRRQIFHTFEVTDVRSYNRATGKLWCVFGIFFILLGIPWLAGKGSSRILIPICGVLPLEILAFAIYELGISRKYRKQQQEDIGKSNDGGCRTAENS